MKKKSHLEPFTPNVKGTFFGLMVGVVIALLVIYIYARRDTAHQGVVRNTMDMRVYNLDPHGSGKVLSGAAKHRRPNIAIVTAYRGLFPEMMASLSDITKRKYAQLHGYTYYVDNHLWKKGETALRATSVLTHLPDHSWVWWTEPETFIVEPSKSLADLVDDKYHVIMSKDWGGRQLCPATIIVRNSEMGQEIAQLWHQYVTNEDGHDDLRSWLKLVKEKPEYEQYIKWVDQHEMAAYPSVELKDNSYKMDKDAGHAYWQPGDRAMHIVNCMRDGKHDNFCCAGIGAHYYHLFEKNFEKLATKMGLLQP